MNDLNLIPAIQTAPTLNDKVPLSLRPIIPKNLRAKAEQDILHILPPLSSGDRIEAKDIYGMLSLSRGHTYKILGNLCLKGWATCRYNEQNVAQYAITLAGERAYLSRVR